MNYNAYKQAFKDDAAGQSPENWPMREEARGRNISLEAITTVPTWEQKTRGWFKEEFLNSGDWGDTETDGEFESGLLQSIEPKVKDDEFGGKT